MKAVPGTLGAGGAPFQPTHWSVVLLAAQSQSQEAARSALADFCQSYWPPLYAFVRRRGYSSDDAQDCIQAFFTHLLEASTLSRACQEKGRLRTFLLGSLQNFMGNEREHRQALKRGGGQQIISFDAHYAEAEAAAHTDPDASETCWYDQTWAAAVTRRAWERLQAALAEEGKGALFAELKTFLAANPVADHNQEETAARLGMPLATLRTHIHRLRQRYRDLLRTEVALTVSHPAETEEEMRYLHRVLLS